ncbi:unnamed protein product, partial [Soboliphyme baturini]|uniref:ADP-ribosylation factor-like protein 2 n=1 Tax=Soboliphyme baturini TaxID=241478 RepID=A0A183IVF1_9BILA
GLKPSWAEQVEAETELPEEEEIIKDGIRTVKHYKFGENGQKVRLLMQYKIERKKVPKAVALRKKWHKFGEAAVLAGEESSQSTTNLGEEVKMQFVRTRTGEPTELNREETDAAKLKVQPQIRVCRYCKSPDHWTPQCPYKDFIEGERAAAEGTVPKDARQKELEEKMKSGTYVPPSLRMGGAARMSTDLNQRRDDTTVRVTNLPEDTTDLVLKDIFSKSGKVYRIYLAKDKITNKCKCCFLVAMGFLTIIRKMKQKENEMRIVVLGLDNAGKTTILKKLNGEDTDSVSPTLGFNIETVELMGWSLNIWDVGGQKSLRSYWRNYFEETDGLIWVVDSSDRLRMPDCKKELKKLLYEERLLGATLLVMANKQDLLGALTADEIRTELDLDSITSSHHWNIVSCSAVTGQNLVEAMEWLVKDITSRVYILE